MASILISNNKSSRTKRLYSNNETQILLKFNNKVKGTTRAVNTTCSYLPGLKTQCALTYHKDFHIVARNTLVGSLKSPGNTSRLLLTGFKTKTTTQEVETFPKHLDVHIAGAECPFNDVLPQVLSLLSLLTSILPTQSHHSLAGKQTTYTVRKRVRMILVHFIPSLIHKEGSELKSHLAVILPSALSSHEKNDDYVHLSKTLKRKPL